MSDGTYKYAQATVTVSNAVPGQMISVVLAPTSSSPDDQVNWSAGQPMQSSSIGIQLSALGGTAVPVNSLSINGTTIVVYTSSSSGGSYALTFSVSAFLVAATALQYINIRSSTDPGPVVTFQFAGQQAIVLSQALVAVKWPL